MTTMLQQVEKQVARATQSYYRIDPKTGRMQSYCQQLMGDTLELSGITLPQSYPSANAARLASTIYTKDPAVAQPGDVVYFLENHVGWYLGNGYFASGTPHSAGAFMSLGRSVYVHHISDYSHLTFAGFARSNGRRPQLTGYTLDSRLPGATPVPGGGVNRITPNATFKTVQGDGVVYKEPTGALMIRIQKGLAARGPSFYDTTKNSIDGDGGINTRKGIQKVLKADGLYASTIDGKIGPNNLKQIQTFAKKYGGYTNKIDGLLLSESWSGFASALGQ